MYIFHLLLAMEIFLGYPCRGALRVAALHVLRVLVLQEEPSSGSGCMCYDMSYCQGAKKRGVCVGGV